MKDYKLSELKEICNQNTNCINCPLFGLCITNSVAVCDLEIDVDEEEKN